jgi:hypothetical protein
VFSEVDERKTVGRVGFIVQLTGTELLHTATQKGWSEEDENVLFFSGIKRRKNWMFPHNSSTHNSY